MHEIPFSNYWPRHSIAQKRYSCLVRPITIRDGVSCQFYLTIHSFSSSSYSFLLINTLIDWYHPRATLKQETNPFLVSWGRTRRAVRHYRRIVNLLSFSVHRHNQVWSVIHHSVIMQQRQPVTLHRARFILRSMLQVEYDDKGQRRYRLITISAILNIKQSRYWPHVDIGHTISSTCLPFL